MMRLLALAPVITLAAEGAMAQPISNVQVAVRDN
jgi:hypothetical protein